MTRFDAMIGEPSESDITPISQFARSIHENIPDEQVAGVYAIICAASNQAENRLYVGESVNVLRRLAQHRQLLRAGNHHAAPLQNAWNKYGEDAFVCVLLEEESDDEKRKLAEVEWYHELSASLNCAIPNGKPSGEWTNERRQQTSEALRAWWADPAAKRRKAEVTRTGWMDPEIRRRRTEGLRAAHTTPAARRHNSENRRKYYDNHGVEKWAIDPNGNVHHVRNYERFAREHGLKCAALHRVLNGHQRTHLDWRAATPQEIADVKRRKVAGDTSLVRCPPASEFFVKPSVVVDPTGQAYCVQHRYNAAFAREHGLDDSGLNKLIHGHSKTHRGWTLADEATAAAARRREANEARNLCQLGAK